MYALRIGTIDSDRVASRVFTAAELMSLRELLQRVRGVETTINERKAADTLRDLLAQAEPQT